MKIRLKILRDGTEVESRVLSEGVHRIGRSEFSDVVLSGEGISRSQLEIRINEASAYFTNMANAGKVRLNGTPKETSEIGDGDELVVGNFRLVISSAAADEVAEPQAVGAPDPENDDRGASDSDQPQADAPAGDGNGFGNAFGGSNESGDAEEKAPDAPAFGGFGDAGADAGGGGFGEADGPAVALKEESNEKSGSMSRGETAIDMKPVVAKLVFQEGARAGEEMFLEAYEVTFGRSKKADVYLDDDRLSRLHSKIIRVGNGYRLVDLNSRNGTFVNGMRVLEHPLTSFDAIQIGDTKIKFLIHDAMMNAFDRADANQLVPAGPRPMDQTKSVQLGAFDGNLAMQMQPEELPQEYPLAEPRQMAAQQSEPEQKRKRTTKMIVGLVLGLLVILILMPSGDETTDTPDATAQVSADADKKDKLAEIKAPQIPKEFAELSEDVQRAVEGHYNSAIAMASQQNYQEAVGHLKRIHQYLPFYKDSLGLQDKYQKKLKEAEIQQAQERAKKDELQDLQIYLQEGMDYLGQGEFERAAESFNTAIVVDPNNEQAIKGLKAAEAKVRRIEDIPPDVDPEAEKRREVGELFKAAGAALSARSYQEAINKAKAIQQIQLQGEVSHIQEAQQIIDRVMALQKEEFEPFLIQAKEKYAEGDYNASRDLCEEMSKRDPNYAEAVECVARARKQLNRLAREAYTHGYILESMNRIEEAKQYWNRARNYVREGDEYYDKTLKKLDYYQ